jgi:hypothetical protein
MSNQLGLISLISGPPGRGFESHSHHSFEYDLYFSVEVVVGSSTIFMASFTSSHEMKLDRRDGGFQPFRRCQRASQSRLQFSPHCQCQPCQCMLMVILCSLSLSPSVRRHST